MSERGADLYLRDILEAARKIIDYTAGLDLNSFRKAPIVIDAVLRNLEVIGEASTHMPSTNTSVWIMKSSGRQSASQSPHLNQR
jgi:uncharacterized protein with HEPN domain